MSNLTPDEMNDFGQPIKHPAVLNFRLSTLDKLFKSGQRFLAFFATYVVVSLIGFQFEWNLLIVIILAFISGTVVESIWFRPRRASPQVIKRNKEIYDRLYAETQSNRWSEVIIGVAATQKFDFYSHTIDDTIAGLKAKMKTEHNMGSMNCHQGHHPTCAHKIPAPLKKWLNA